MAQIYKYFMRRFLVRNSKKSTYEFASNNYFKPIFDFTRFINENFLSWSKHYQIIFFFLLRFFEHHPL